MSDEKTPESQNHPESTEEYEFLVGDKIHIPTHGGKFVAEIVHCYANLEEACESYKGSYRTILQSPFGKAKPHQPFYYCEVANSTRKPLGVAQEHATLKWRQPAAAE